MKKIFLLIALAVVMTAANPRPATGAQRAAQVRQPEKICYVSSPQGDIWLVTPPGLTSNPGYVAWVVLQTPTGYPWWYPVATLEAPPAGCR